MTEAELEPSLFGEEEEKRMGRKMNSSPDGNKEAEESNTSSPSIISLSNEREEKEEEVKKEEEEEQSSRQLASLEIPDFPLPNTIEGNRGKSSHRSAMLHLYLSPAQTHCFWCCVLNTTI